MVSTQKFMFEMPHLDHNGFVSYWKFFDMCTSNTTVNPLIKSYDVINETALKFFMTHLKIVPNLHTKDNTFQILESEYILKDTSDNAIVSSLLNTVLSYGIDTAISEMTKNKNAYLTKENEINILGKMFIDKEISTSIRLYLANVELHPNSWKAYYNLGFCYKKANNLPLATEALKKAIEL